MGIVYGPWAALERRGTEMPGTRLGSVYLVHLILSPMKDHPRATRRPVNIKQEQGPVRCQEPRTWPNRDIEMLPLRRSLILFRVVSDATTFGVSSFHDC